MNTETLAEAVKNNPKLAGMLLSAAVLLNTAVGSAVATSSHCGGP